MIKQTSMFPDIVPDEEITPISKEEENSTILAEKSTPFLDLGKNLMDSAVSGKIIDKPDTTHLNNRAQTFLLGVQLNRMDTVRKLLNRVESVEEVMTDPEKLKDLHPQWLVMIYEALSKNVDNQINQLTLVKETIAASINIFNTQINQNNTDPSFDPNKTIPLESREKIMNVLKGVIDLNKFVNKGEPQ